MSNEFFKELSVSFMEAIHDGVQSFGAEYPEYNFGIQVEKQAERSFEPLDDDFARVMAPYVSKYRIEMMCAGNKVSLSGVSAGSEEVSRVAELIKQAKQQASFFNPQTRQLG